MYEFENSARQETGGGAASIVGGPSIGGSVALVHDWCPSFRGGERVLAELKNIFHVNDIFTLFQFLEPDVLEAHFSGATFHTCAFNNWPGMRRFYRHLLPICPLLIEQFDVTGFDAVISSSAAFARGVITRPDQAHLCYVHSPMRYAWDEQFSYVNQMGPGSVSRLVLRAVLHHMRTWDVRTAYAPDVMVANSNYVRLRIRRIYGRDAQVVYPPVDVAPEAFSADKDDYYVTASFLAPYKRTDLVIRAFNAMPTKRLLVIGEGQQSRALRSIAGPNVTFTGFLARGDYLRSIAHARAMVFAGCEDFGIALAEAQALGTPLVAFARGGAQDIVVPPGAAQEPTGILFDRQDEATVIDAISVFEAGHTQFYPDACRERAGLFSPARFHRGIRRAFDMALDVHRPVAHGRKDRSPPGVILTATGERQRSKSRGGVRSEGVQ